jgi:hypothetical protein
MKTARILAWLLVLWPSAALSQVTTPADYDRFGEFFDVSVKSPSFWVLAVGAGTLDEMNKFPTEWESQGHAAAKRQLGRIGQSFIAATIESTVASAFDQHVGYERCGCSGFWRRTGHAFWRTFVQRHVDGHLVLNAPFLAAKYGSAAAGNAWYPESYETGDVIGQGSFAVGTAIGLNFLEEFSPDLLHLIHLR